MAEVNSPFAGMSDQDLMAMLRPSGMNLGGGAPMRPAMGVSLPAEEIQAEIARRKKYQDAGLTGGGYQAALRGNFGPGAPVQGQLSGTGQEAPPSPPPGPEPTPPVLTGAFGPPVAPAPAPTAPAPAPTAPAPAAPGVLAPAMGPRAPAQPSRAPMIPGQIDPGAMPTPAAPAVPPQAPAAAQDTWGVMDRFEGRRLNPNPGVAGAGAGGFGQIIPSTYADLTRKYRARNPWMPATHAEYVAATGNNSPEATALGRRMYDEVIRPNEYEPALQRAGLPSTPVTLAVTNFLGVAGGPAFLRAAAENPQGIASQMVSPGAAANNRGVFFDPSGKPRTAMEVMQRIQSGSGGGGGAPAANSSATNDAPAAPAGPATKERGGIPPWAMSEAPDPRDGNERDPMKNGQFLLALGAGMLGGKGFGDGISKGMAAAQALRTGYTASQDKRDENNANRALAGARLAETQRSHLQNEGTAVGRLGQSQQRLTVQQNVAAGYVPFGQPFQNEAGETVFAMRSKTGGDVRYGVMGSQAPTAGATATPQATVATPGGSPSPAAPQAPGVAPTASTGPGPLTPVAQNTQTHRHALADNLKTDREIAETASGGRQQIADLANFRAAVTNAGGQMGPTAMAHVRRFMTSTFGDGFGENVSDLDLLKKAATTANSADALARAKGNFARFTQGEFQQLGRGFAMLETDPRAAMVIIDESLKKAQARLAAADRYFSPEFEAERMGMQGKAGANRAWWQQQMAGNPATSGNNGESAWAPGPNGNLIYKGTTQSGGPMTIERIN